MDPSEQIPARTPWHVLLLAGIFALFALAALLFGYLMFVMAGGSPEKNMGHLVVSVVGLFGLPVMGLLLAATIWFAAWADCLARAFRVALPLLVAVALLADLIAVARLFMPHPPRAHIRFYTSGLNEALGAGDVPRAKEILKRYDAWSWWDDRGQTVLCIAAKRGDKPMLEMLLTHCAKDINTVHHNALHCAVRSGNIDAARLLLDQGAWVNDEDQEGKTPLACAEESGNGPMAKLLQERGATLVGFERQVVKAARDGDTARVEELLSMDVKAKRPPLLQIAAERGDMAMAEMLLKKGEKVTARTDEGTAIECAAREGQVEMIRFLISKGADPKLCLEPPSQPLQSAVVHGRTEAVRILLDAGAGPNGLIWTGESFVSFIEAAKRSQHTEIVELLRQHGAKE